MQRKGVRRLVLSLAIVLPLLGVSGILSIVVRHSQQRVVTSTRKLRKTWKRDEEAGVPGQELLPLQQNLKKLTSRRLGFIPATWFATYDGTTGSLQNLRGQTSTLWTKTMKSTKQQAETALKALEKTMGSFSATEHQARLQALKQATTPNAYRQLTQAWKQKKQSWTATVAKLKHVSGGYSDGHPSDVFKEVKTLTSMLKSAPNTKKVKSARVTVTDIKKYFAQSPQVQLKEHAEVLKQLKNAIHNVHVADVMRYQEEAGANPFGKPFTNYLRTRQSQVSVAIFNAKTGKTLTYHPSQRYDTASIVKATIMADLLYQSQKNHKPLSKEEQSLMTPMIEVSSNQAASKLWNTAGAARGIGQFVHSVGMNHTTPGQNGYWGLTTTTALDEVDLMKLFAFPNHVLDYTSRQYGLSLMRHVVGWEDWGVSTGAKGKVVVALKNGWVPTAKSHWHVNSIGFIDGDGRDYVIAVMSEENPSEQYGIQTVDKVSQMIWEAMG
ncbi:serine hydrolase [Alicyclobacillus sp. SO9]|uniref:serine hydrolase n=1 Tax=Alicyclobacillus sp. SO9 TaxID=2665646 RepID=UPI0018E75219|nr:serine hydrolase [Alicyclobacillus sp. SO9]QQE78149.1 hypothetical protein GI364_20035 [Alicyclobacillus sp. SO9]